MTPEIRKRRIEDSLELAHNIALVWNSTYKGIVDDEFSKHLGGKYIGNHLFREKYLENIYLFEL